MAKIHIKRPTLLLSLIPVVTLLGVITVSIIVDGTENIHRYGSVALLVAAALSGLLSVAVCRRPLRLLWLGVIKSARQIVPSLPILLLIGVISATWMLGGIVPLLIDYGLRIISPPMFLLATCAVCSLISVLTGSSWTTVATIGVAFMGIGTVLGYSPAWTAGAVISGAYFGDKVSPLSDTTVLASSTVGVSLPSHIKFNMLTALPSLLIALAVFASVGLFSETTHASQGGRMADALASTFNLTPWVLVVPAVTVAMIYFRVDTIVTLSVSSLLGIVSMFLFQPQIASQIDDSPFGAAIQTILTHTSLSTGNELLDPLVSTGGMSGMLPTIRLVVCAMIFGGMMIGSGMISTVTRAVGRRLRTARTIVPATVGGGLLINGFTGDQYLSIILNGNIFRKLYVRNGLRRKVLSRSLEDSVSVTSALIPWSSCGMTQSAVLGVATLAYLPCAIFNLVSPLMSILLAWTGYRIHAARG